jgi:hypothetical protein
VGVVGAFIYWRCGACGQLHNQHEIACLFCRHEELEPVSAVAVDDVSEGVATPEPMDSSDIRTDGTAHGDVGTGSPDVGLDGSMQRDSEASGAQDRERSRGVVRRLRARLRRLF